jgi:pyruvate dehydrogenase E2 component (dihydrolipoamide acetyltransferase)
MAEKILMIALSPTMEKGVIFKWNKKEGDYVKQGETLCEVETDKATMEYESPVEGILLNIQVPQGEKAFVGDLIAIVGEKGEDISKILADAKSSQKEIRTPEKQAKTPGMEVQKTYGEAKEERIKASPLAKKMSKESNISLNTIAGSGPEGRIIKRDVEKTMMEKTIPSAGISVVEIAPVSEKRKVIAQRLSQSKYSAPHYYLKVSVDMGVVLKARQDLNASLPNKVSMNAFFIKFCAEALKKHHIVNATWKGDTIEKHRNSDIGFAVAQPDGLIAPVVRDCGNKGILQIDREMKSLIEKAQSNKLAWEDFQNATFTISNLGSFGIEEFTAIINPPGSAILALGAIRKEPVVKENDTIEIQSRMKMTLSCDHRIIDGAVGASFLKDLKDILENPIVAMY